ncbi:murein hydrolase activator EnvC [uncultured Ruminococcus sp.]|uniref:murein hydrolase activator EnvC family protein n=1 Tax=uncultured Ruminococcus sp. TaxID=165186 RepID=UPI0025ED76E8|nr:peptidoglycan DD-metalloendopeptidase family protein [uncultured Ruminococcus sp.]
MNRLKRILCALLSVCIISMPVALSAVSAGAESIDSMQQQLQELEQKNQEYQDILDKTQSDINEKEEYNKALVSKIEVLDDKIALTRESINDLNDSIEQKQKDIDKANEDIDGQLDTLCERLRTIYMAGNASDIEIIFGAKDFSDFIDKVSLVQTLSSYDKELIDGINVKLEKITEQKTALEEDKAELEKQQASLEEDQSELNELLEENEETLRNLYTSNNNAKSALENAAAQSAELENQIKAYYKDQQDKISQLGGNNSGNNGNSGSGTSDNGESNGGGSYTPVQPETPDIDVPSGSGFVWPAPGCYTLTSPFGENRGYSHGGIDIGTPMGTTIVAAESGTVIASNNSCPHNWGKNGSCGCGGGYGNYVFIDHGNGKLTIYGHLTNAIVSTGQTVSKGQTIGYAGSTGNSTGPHLHFECQYYGVKYDPMSEY